MAAFDLIGQAVFGTHTIYDHDRQPWQMKSNRRIMPTRWIVSDPQKRVVIQFDQKILGKLINPIYKVLLGLLDDDGREVYRLVDPRTNIPDRIMAPNTGKWVLMAGDRAVATLGSLPRNQDPPKGVFKFLKKFFIPSDNAFFSAGNHHLLPAPVVLGMLLIVDELNDNSAG